MRAFDFALDVCNVAPDMEQFHELDPVLQFIFLDASTYSYRTYGKRLLITCVQRPAKHAEDLHAPKFKRAIDANIDQAGVIETELDPAQAEDVCNYVNSRWCYDPARQDMCVAVYGWRDESGKHDTHIHFQSHPRTVIVDETERDPLA